MQKLSYLYAEDDDGGDGRGTVTDMYANLNDKDGLMDEEGNKTEAVLATTYFEMALLDED